jgi:DNA-binding CsgD family transcriptional regulator
VLVGRDSERRTIATLLAGARVGDSRVLVLSGEPGIGKTSLLTEAAGLVEEMQVLRSQGVESEQFVPFAGLLQLLRPLLPLLDQIPAPQASALSSALLLDAGADAEPSRFAVGAATLSLLSRAAEDRPLAVLVDDGHLIDGPSAEALVFAARRLLSDAVALLVTVRAGEPGAAVWATLPTLEVSGLDVEAARELVAGATGPLRRPQLLRLHRATGGNPLAMLELGDRLERIEAVPAESPVTVSEAVSRAFSGRVQDLGDDARTSLLVAATDSASAATVYEACAALGLADPGLTEAEDAGLVSVLGDRIEFRHPLVRSAVYGAADPETRRAVHRALAGVVPEGETDRLAWHLSEGAVAPDEATAGTLAEVAGQATARGAHAIAANALERAAELTGIPALRTQRLAAAGSAAWLAGQTERALDLLHRALARTPDPRLRAHIQELRGAVETRCGSLDDALATLMGAALAVEESDPDTAIRLYSDAIHVCFYLGTPAPAMNACAAIDRLEPHSVDPNARVLGTMASGMALVLAGAGSQGIERLRGSARSLVDPTDVSEGRFRHPLRTQGSLWLRESGEVRDQVNEAIVRLRERAALGSLPHLLMMTARDSATADRWDDAEAGYLEAIRLAGETGQSTDFAVCTSGLAVLNARRGRAQECRENVAAAGEVARRNNIRVASFWLEFAQGDLAAGSGDTATAVRHYEALEAALAATGLADPDQSCAPELVEAYVHLGRADEADRLAREFADRALAKGQPWSLARAERALGISAPDGEADDHFGRALDLHARTPDLFETARTELAYGSRLRRERQRVEARPHLRSALETFERLGAAPWADKAAAELEATGETVRRREANAMDDLTPQERQIAQMLASGRTTREAAAALFISPKTVEYHLRHVYLKLDIRSRDALAELFGG